MGSFVFGMALDHGLRDVLLLLDVMADVMADDIAPAPHEAGDNADRSRRDSTLLRGREHEPVSIQTRLHDTRTRTLGTHERPRKEQRPIAVDVPQMYRPSTALSAAKYARTGPPETVFAAKNTEPNICTTHLSTPRQPVWVCVLHVCPPEGNMQCQRTPIADIDRRNLEVEGDHPILDRSAEHLVLKLRYSGLQGNASELLNECTAGRVLKPFHINEVE